MALANLHREVIEEIKGEFPGRRFVKSSRSFVQQHENCKWYLHLAFVNHVDDFDIVADVAVEHLIGRRRICILGAELGNIAGTGQHRWTLRQDSSVLAVVKSIRTFFNQAGAPFLERFSDLAEVLETLRTDESTTRLIFPFENNPAFEADRIESLIAENKLP